MNYNENGFMLILLTIAVIGSLAYVFDKIVIGSRKKKREKTVNEYLEYLKKNNSEYYNLVKNKKYRNQGFYLKANLYQATKGKINETVLQYARDNDLREIPIKEVKKIMIKKGIKF